MKMHTVIGFFIMVAIVMQLSKPLRDRAKWLHRWTGRVLILVALAATPSFASLVAGIDFAGVKYSHTISLVMNPFCEATPAAPPPHRHHTSSHPPHEASMRAATSCPCPCCMNPPPAMPHGSRPSRPILVASFTMSGERVYRTSSCSALVSGALLTHRCPFPPSQSASRAGSRSDRATSRPTSPR